MFCMNCGCKAPDGAMFCSNCGARLAGLPYSSAMNETSAAPPDSDVTVPVTEPGVPAESPAPDYDATIPVHDFAPPEQEQIPAGADAANPDFESAASAFEPGTTTVPQESAGSDPALSARQTPESVPADPGTDTPGLNADAPDFDTNMPAADADTPGLEADMPGLSTNMPASDAATSALDTDMPASDAVTPVSDADTPPDFDADATVAVYDSIPGQENGSMIPDGQSGHTPPLPDETAALYAAVSPAQEQTPPQAQDQAIPPYTPQAQNQAVPPYTPPQAPNQPVSPYTPAGSAAPLRKSAAAAPVKKKSKWKGFVFGLLITTAVIAALAAIFILAGGVNKVSAAWQMNVGNRYLSELDYEAAVVAFSKVIEIEPNNENAYLKLADAYVGLEDYDSALEVLRDGIRATDSDRLRKRREEIAAECRRFSGTVYSVDTDLDNSNNPELPEVTVEITGPEGADEETFTCETDENGHFQTGILEKGRYKLRYYSDDYLDYTQTDVELDDGVCEVEVVMEPDSFSNLYGNVRIADTDTDYSNNEPLSGATVSLKKLTGSSIMENSTVTDADGQYDFSGLVMGVYELTVSMDGYQTVVQNIVIYEGQNVSYNTLIEIIGSQWSGQGTASGMIYDALTGQGVPGLTLNLRRGLNNTQGEPEAVFQTDENGSYRTPELDSGNYCLQIIDMRSLNEGGREDHTDGETSGETERHINIFGTTESTETAEDSEDDGSMEDADDNGSGRGGDADELRYLETSINIKILGGEHIGNQDGTVSNSLMLGQVRIVMSWGETPNDLDSHLFCVMESGDYGHIYFSDRTFYDSDGTIANLDRDDTDCYGPETTTIYRDDPGEYTFAINNYSHGNTSQLPQSKACVQVYMGSSNIPAYVFYVPNQTGYVWEVFRYNSRTGVLTPINAMYDSYSGPA